MMIEIHPDINARAASAEIGPNHIVHPGHDCVGHDVYLVWKFGHPAPLLLRAVGSHLECVMLSKQRLAFERKKG